MIRKSAEKLGCRSFIRSALNGQAGEALKVELSVALVSAIAIPLMCDEREPVFLTVPDKRDARPWSLELCDAGPKWTSVLGAYAGEAPRSEVHSDLRLDPGEEIGGEHVA
jgi:hypothetical protein